MEGVVTERLAHGVVVIRIDRPESQNALDEGVHAGLVQCFQSFTDDDSTRCVVLTGSDRVFTSGADLKSLVRASATDMMLRERRMSWEAMESFPKPVIAAVKGWALGGGCELAMRADIIIAGESAKFGQPELKVGIIPGAGGTQRLTRAIGKYKAMKILLSGEYVTARDAEAMGLVSEVVPDSAVDDRAVELARTIAAMPPLAVRKLKDVVLAGADLPLEAALKLENQACQILFDTADQEEGMAAFIEKRPPSFKGR